ncbi:MAG TPA: VIT1/CCC1 family protein [Pseudonocardia sp.]|jgi:vacuolar iron transporter family protein|nr:VIT1/CCC1 family protein [Pseudonocardia sp.]
MSVRDDGSTNRPEPPHGPVDRSTLRRWRRRLADEHAEAAVYRDLAARRTGEDREILLAIAQAEERHAAHWQQLLGDQVGRLGRGSLRIRLLAVLARRFGSVFVLALAQRSESRSPYRTDPEATPAMAADERIHEEVLRGLAARGRARVSGTFRAAVFGANDGLVSNLALVLGVAGAGVDTTSVLLTGLAGLLSGALSMGAGEYVSVRSQRELLSASSPVTSDASQVLPNLDLDENELALVMRARGMAEDEARRRARALLSTYDPAEPVPAGIDEDEHEAVGTGLGAAASSFSFFAVGAAVPVLPFVVGFTGPAALVAAVALVGVALMATGATVGILSGGPPLRRALRQLLIGAGAAATTYGLGLTLGAVLD